MLQLINYYLPVYLNSTREMLNVNIRNTTFDFNPWFRLNKTEDSSTIFSHFVRLSI
jgi:hypothetical protein